MSKAMKRHWFWLFIALCTVVLVLADLWHADEMRIPRPFMPKGIVAFPGAKSVVAIVGSDDHDLTNPAPMMPGPEYDDPHNDIEPRLNKEQIEEMVYKALDMDTSERSIREVVKPGDWVGIKINMVTIPNGVGVTTSYGPQVDRRGNPRNNWGRPHWGQTTDIRVLRAVIKYLIEVDGDASRLTIVEGGGEWFKLGENDPRAPANMEHDGWTCRWEPFDNLSNMDVINEFKTNGKGIVVDFVDLNYDDYVDEDGNAHPWTDHYPGTPPLPVPDPNGTGVTWFQREEGFYVSKTLLELDKLISIPAMKIHDIPGVTAVFKQYVGTFMHQAYGAASSNLKMGLHGDGNDKVPNGYMDLFSYRPTNYSVVEGIWGTEHNGPQTGDDVKLNVIVAGGDPVATESVVAQIMGFNPYDVYHIHLAAAKGFGTWDPHQIEVVGRSIEEVRRPFEKPDNWILGPMGVNRWLVNGPYTGSGSPIENDYLGDEASVTGKEGEMTGDYAWQVVEADIRDHSIMKIGDQSKQVHYLFTLVVSDEDRDVDLSVEGASGDLTKVWLNGEPVVDQATNSIEKAVSLKKGTNRLLVKVLNVASQANLKVVLMDDQQNSPEYRLTDPSTAVEQELTATPTALRLDQNYPNPFNPYTWIPFEIAQTGHVQLAIYDLLGQKVRTLLDKELAGGVGYTTFWNSKNDQGQEVASGVYLVRMTAGHLSMTRKIALVR